MDVMGRLSITAVDFIWQIFIFVSAVAAKMLGFVADPSFLEKMEDTYRNLTSDLFSVVNPLIIGTLGLAITVFYLFIDDKRIDGNDFQRIGAAVILLLGIALITLNPFKIIHGLMTSVQTLVTIIGGENTAAGGSAVVDFLIRQPTLIINYNGNLPATCSEQWSSSNSKMESCASGGNSSSSLEAMSEATTSTIFLALIAAFMGITAFAFAAQAIWKFIKHLTLGILGFLALGWVAAVSMTRRRQFDSVGTMTALALGHLAMALIVQVISIGGPTLVMTFMSSWGQQAAVLKMMMLAVSYIVLFVVLSKVTKETGPIVKALKAGGADDIYRNLGLTTEGKELPLQASGGSMGSAASAFRAQADQRSVELVQNRRGSASEGSAAGGLAPEEDVDAASKPAGFTTPSNRPLVSIFIKKTSGNANPQPVEDSDPERTEQPEPVERSNAAPFTQRVEDANQEPAEQPEPVDKVRPNTDPHNDTSVPDVGNPLDIGGEPEMDQDKVKDGLDEEAAAQSARDQAQADAKFGPRAPQTVKDDWVARLRENRQRLRENGQRLRDTRQQVQESRIAGKADEELAASDVLMGTKLRAYTSVARDSLISPEKRNRVAASYPAYAAKKSLAAGKALWGGSATPGDSELNRVSGDVRTPLDSVAKESEKHKQEAWGNQTQMPEDPGTYITIEDGPDGVTISVSGAGHSLGETHTKPSGNTSVNTEDNSKKLAPENAATP